MIAFLRRSPRLHKKRGKWGCLTPPWYVDENTRRDVLSESKRNFLFTSESVTEGHPDKIADQISDAVLDEVMRQDPKGRVACETLVTTGLVVVAGEITTSAHVDYDELIRKTVEQVGYDNALYGFDANTCAVMCTIKRQSPDIAMVWTRAAPAIRASCSASPAM